MAVTDEKMFFSYQEMTAAISGLYKKVVIGILNRSKQIISECVFEAAENRQCLPSYDARLFEYCELTIENYRNILKTECNNAAGSREEGIWGGIVDIITSRIKMFEERLETNHRYVGNPVLQEKKAVLEKSVRTFADGFENWKNRYAEDMNSDCCTCLPGTDGKYLADGNRCLLQYIDNICNNIESTCFPRFYEFYASTLKFALYGLNDMQLREEARFYHGMLFEERDVLSMIVNVQLPKLKSGNTVNGCEAQIAVICDAYEQLEKRAAEIDRLNKTQDKKLKAPYSNDEMITLMCEKLAAYKNELAEKLTVDASNAIAEIEKFDNMIAEFVKSNVIAETKKNADSVVYDFNKKSFLAKAVTADICNEFLRLIRFYDGNKANFAKEVIGDSREAAIIEGVAESIKIKRESLNEMMSDFFEKTKEFVEKYLTEADALYEKNVNNEDVVFFADILKKNPPKEIECIKKVVIAFINDGNYLNDINKINTRYAKGLNKLISTYKRESLLYEVSTFEEIIKYSIEVMRESSNSGTQMFVEKTNKTYSEIVKTLAKYGITVIKPLIKSNFDAKEHEVLTAEVLEGYAKGEIIKVLNCGYKQDGEVLLRANVVAAK